MTAFKDLIIKRVHRHDTLLKKTKQIPLKIVQYWFPCTLQCTVVYTVPVCSMYLFCDLTFSFFFLRVWMESASRSAPPAGRLTGVTQPVSQLGGIGGASLYVSANRQVFIHKRLLWLFSATAPLL
jgi:hypothetical protein